MATLEDVRSSRPRGYTLIEMLLVMGIVIMLLTLVLVAVNSMLRSSRLNRSVSLLVASVDEARTSGITIRRTTRIDVTAMDDQGKITRMTVFGPGISNNFEQYNLPDPSVTNAPSDPQLKVDWKTTGKDPIVVTDGSRCMRMSGAGSSAVYWYRGKGVDAVSVGDYAESILFARVKILPGIQRVNKQPITLGVLGVIDDGGGKAIKSSYRMAMKIIPAPSSARNLSSSVELQRYTGGSGKTLSAGADGDGPATIQFDQAGSGGPSSPSALLVENVWYRVMLSVKAYTPEIANAQPQAIVSGKIWADGQLEPLIYTVGPITDKGSTQTNGFGGFSVDNCDVLVDDVLFDMRPVRLVPQGVSITALDPNDSYNPAKRNSPFSFPILFRPDGTTATYSIIEIADSTTGDKRYVRIDPNTGRARVGSALEQVKQ